MTDTMHNNMNAPVCFLIKFTHRILHVLIILWYEDEICVGPGKQEQLDYQKSVVADFVSDKA